MKKILISLATMVFVGAMAYGATGAFFTSTQTSTGNTFTAGTIAFTVDSTAEYDGNTCTAEVWTGSSSYPTGDCTESWKATTLGVTNQFFDYTDIKPQDQGEDTISLDNSGNPAWACMAIDLTQNSLTSTPVVPFNGFLGDDIQVFLWRDTGATDDSTPGDNLYNPAGGDVAITSAPQSINSLYGTGSTTAPETVDLPLIDSTHGGNTPLPGGGDSYVGIAWCAGTLGLPASPNGPFTCDGTNMGNPAQGNSLMANITLMESQSRNQPGYECPTGVTVDNAATIDVTKVVVDDTTGTEPSTTGLAASDFEIHVLNSGDTDVSGSPQIGSTSGTTYSDLAAGTYTVTETTGAVPIPAGDTDTVSFTGNCNATSGSVTLTGGEAAACTMTNTITGTVE